MRIAARTLGRSASVASSMTARAYASASGPPVASTSRTCTPSSSRTARPRPGGICRARRCRISARSRISTTSCASAVPRPRRENRLGTRSPHSSPHSVSRERICVRRCGVRPASAGSDAGTSPASTRWRRSRVATSAGVRPPSAPTSSRPATFAAGTPPCRSTSRAIAVSRISYRAASRCSRSARTRAASAARLAADRSGALRCSCSSTSRATRVRYFGWSRWRCQKPHTSSSRTATSASVGSAPSSGRS